LSSLVGAAAEIPFELTVIEAIEVGIGGRYCVSRESEVTCRFDAWRA
jgi:hypothetical protein